jgi:hypothetical protein
MPDDCAGIFWQNLIDGRKAARCRDQSIRPRLRADQLRERDAAPHQRESGVPDLHLVVELRKWIPGRVWKDSQSLSCATTW